MRVTRNLLLETARNHVKSQTLNNPDIACVFLVGSLLSDNPFIGENTDIDLVFIHNTEPAAPREVIPMGDEFNLDILHFPRRIFNQPKTLREDPWLGCLFCEKPFVLYDSYHFYDFLRAGVYSNFFSPTYAYARSQYFYIRARKRWMDLHQAEQGKNFSVSFVFAYLQTLYDAANTIACLTGKPIPERRFLTTLEAITTYLGRPGLASGMRDLFAPTNYDLIDWQDLHQQLTIIFSILSDKSYCPPQYAPARVNYYLGAASYYQVERFDESIWILLWVWTNIMQMLPKRSPEVRGWKDFCEQLNFSRDSIPLKLQQLDIYLDAVDETCGEWGKVSGLL
ncbi:MAG: hypothetical protein GYA18_04855 [Chloroflexi bacterium]|nr:hypothetical protein [Chloroflexota bacterium]